MCMSEEIDKERLHFIIYNSVKYSSSSEAGVISVG
jgi:hypothetical protein